MRKSRDALNFLTALNFFQPQLVFGINAFKVMWFNLVLVTVLIFPHFQPALYLCNVYR